ncbi:MAG: hypothetical protein A2X49_01120 [Lentisphaerae bacterium GWF2_52_8]|nr:MAG: hypothetical protein A2X49_01120 [Lentisphaerae bacterium GWF2_52_8]
MPEEANEKNAALEPAQVEREIRKLYVATAFYGIVEILFVNSFMLLYFSTLGVRSERILFYLAMPMFVRMFALIFFAEWAERLGKVRTGVSGLLITTFSALLLIIAGFAPKSLIEPLILLAVSLYGMGYGIHLTSWFPVLSTIVPSKRRGRFFGVMRFIYQTVGIIFTFIVGLTLGKDSSIAIFQFYLVLAVIFRLVGISFYARLPDLESRRKTGRTILDSIWHVIGKDGFLAFCSYVFLLSLFTGSCQSIFSLLAKDTLGMAEGQVIFLGNLVTLGALLGYFCGGIMVDKVGTKYVFLFCHFSFAASLVLFLSRDFLLLPVMLVIGSLSFAFGLVQAASGIAISSEMIAISPHDNKSMSTALCYSLMSLGIALSGIFSSGILKLGILSSSWQLLGKSFGPYDALLLFCGVMVFLMTVTLGLVPSVVKKAQWG